jgi:hypothetical protein
VILLLIIPQNPLKNMLRCLYPFPKTQHDLITNYSQNPFQKAQRDLAYQLFNGSLKKTQHDLAYQLFNSSRNEG